MNQILLQRFAGAALVGAVGLGVGIGCSSKVCTASEESACTSTYTSCINAAALTADKGACQKCVDDYCACYSACGNTCNKAQLSGQCQ